MHWMHKSLNPGVLLWVMVRDGFERGDLFPRWFHLGTVLATSALQGVKPPVYKKLCKTYSSWNCKIWVPIRRAQRSKPVHLILSVFVQRVCILDFGLPPLALPEGRLRAPFQLYPCDAHGCPSLSQVKAHAGFNLSCKVTGIGATLEALLQESEQKRKISRASGILKSSLPLGAEGHFAERGGFLLLVDVAIR